ncbi:MAG TPA: hypothetical protein VIG24_07355 [Acidimicrobiia bacterium]
MMYRVLSKRMPFPAGSVVSADDLGGNLSVLLAGGKIVPVEAAPKKASKKLQEPEPVPALEDDSAEEPEEQE